MAVEQVCQKLQVKENIWVDCKTVVEIYYRHKNYWRDVNNVISNLLLYVKKSFLKLFVESAASGSIMTVGPRCCISLPLTNRKS